MIRLCPNLLCGLGLLDDEGLLAREGVVHRPDRLAVRDRQALRLARHDTNKPRGSHTRWRGQAPCSAARPPHKVENDYSSIDAGAEVLMPTLSVMATTPLRSPVLDAVLTSGSNPCVKLLNCLSVSPTSTAPSRLSRIDRIACVAHAFVITCTATTTTTQRQTGYGQSGG
jgi:hypothetical protein